MRRAQEAACSGNSALAWSTRWRTKTFSRSESSPSCAREQQENIIAWDGNCYVYHQIWPDRISEIR